MPDIMGHQCPAQLDGSLSGPYEWQFIFVPVKELFTLAINYLVWKNWKSVLLGVVMGASTLTLAAQDDGGVSEFGTPLSLGKRNHRRRIT